MNTIPDIFFDRIEQSGEKTAIVFWHDDQSHARKWSEIAADVVRAATRLAESGVGPGGKVVQISENRYEWIVTDLAIQCLGALHIPLNHLLTSAQTIQLLDHCRPDLVICSRSIIADEIFAATDRRVVLHGDLSWEENSRPTNRSFDKSLNFPDDPLLAHDLDEFAKIARERVAPETLCTILYTSGTTGEPKGVMLNQRNIVSNVQAKRATLPLGEQDVRLCFLPMSHIFSRTCDLYTWISAGCLNVLSRGREFLIEELRNVRPTYLNAVPYIYEKLHRMLSQQGRLDQQGALRDLLGGRIGICNCGGAPIAAHVYEYYRDQGIELVVGYGLTETSPVVSSNSPDANRAGSVGRAVPDVEISIAADGEVLVRGPNVMVGYFRDDEATKAARDGGWFKTGDLGRLDDDRYLYLIGRKKELIVTTGGRNIAPLPIESQLDCDPLILQSMVVGDEMDYLMAIIVPEFSQLSQTLGTPISELRAELNATKPVISNDIHDELSLPASVVTVIRSVIDDRLSGFAEFEQVRHFVITADPFSIENGLLTPKLGLRRHCISERFASAIDRGYQLARTNRNPAAPEPTLREDERSSLWRT